MKMLFRLALAMQEPDVEAFAARTTMRTLTLWWGFWLVEPFGDEWRQSARLAMQARVLAGVDVQPGDEEKWMPNYREPVQTEDQVVAELAKIPRFAAQLRAAGRIK